MCLAIPGKVVELKDGGKTAIVDYGSEKREVDNSLVNAKVGDWVIVQFKTIVNKLSEEEAEEMLTAWKEINR